MNYNNDEMGKRRKTFLGYKGEGHRETEPQESNGFWGWVTLSAEKRIDSRLNPENDGYLIHWATD